ncbi:kinase-like domain-containing protein [Pseudoneurospora amorphoporcata]|uniref:non-specific serine/threonine protein kinase n=1 Tax=Pseudoneurospora amorphoporcata TaxID=241081 RepID=A0AAN6SH55_9PEZI|nr:kinase-like domain-containing protein [Pseudoneurospora amorphoporcata]
MSRSESRNEWQKALPTTHWGRVERLSHQELEAHEREIIKEWESSPGHWSGIGKHTDTTPEHLEKAKRHHDQFKNNPNSQLGRGSYGIVDKVYLTVKNRSIRLARKHIPQRRHIRLEDLRQEAKVMEKLEHEHIVKLIGSYCYRNVPELYLLLWPVAVCNLDDLFNDLHLLQTGQDDRDEILSRLATLDLTDLGALESPYLQLTAKHVSPSYGNRCLFRYMRQMMGCLTRALAYLHKSDVRHLDLKPGNILLSPGRVYLADFGIARDVHDRENTLTLGQQGTPKWRAPEVSRVSDEWSMRAADVYSLGMVLLNISTVVYGAKIAEFDHVAGKLPEQGRDALLDQFLGSLERYALATQDYKDFRAPTVGPKHTVNLIRRMSSTKPSERPAADEADLELVELGGIDQVYHASCCKKSSRFVTEKLDSRLKHVTEDRKRLLAEHEKITKRLAELEAKDATYEARIRNETNHVAERFKQICEQLEKRVENEAEERKRLEARLMELQTGRRQRVPIASRRTSTPAPASTKAISAPSGLKIPSRPPTHPLPATSSSAPAVQTLVKMPTPIADLNARPSYSQAVSTGTSSIPVPQSATRRDSIRRDSIVRPANLLNSPIPAVGPKRSPTLEVVPANYPLRPSTSASRLPRAVNPATPIRSSTPSTPRYNRNTSSADSTQNSMNSSTLSLSRSLYSDFSMPTTVENTPNVKSPYPDRITKKPDEMIAESHYNDAATAIRAESVGLSLGYEKHIERAESVASRENHADNEEREMRDDSSVVSFAPSTSTAPSVGSGYSRTATGKKIPSLPTAPSWADVARTIPQWRK